MGCALISRIGASLKQDLRPMSELDMIRSFSCWKGTTSFVQALNESLESGSLMCQLYSAELNKYVMNYQFTSLALKLIIP